ncbi:hypothetical protein SAMN03080617_03689 [Algoriphagus alkaliphilus]|uniref:Uncharacterized protein n=1 Tax=Algoriphagus alkaliphilus TaxID=279824 RepID=A0A1G5YBU3_9BACT|nr:hypothetical protein SAMN03080617_02430 [Algoriphagus alkaliphilus]SDA93131.1 hypothetical protein SAMN03080617_03689 [Algoriphagus alkaliphilus]
MRDSLSAAADASKVRSPTFYQELVVQVANVRIDLAFPGKLLPAT